MNSLGPLLGVGLTLDQNLLVMFLGVNLAFSLAGVILLFRDRPMVDKVFILAGMYLIISVGSLLGLHWFARTPVRDMQVFQVE